MPDYKAPLRDMRFLMDEVFDYPATYAAIGAVDATPDLVGAILEGAELGAAQPPPLWLGARAADVSLRALR